LYDRGPVDVPLPDEMFTLHPSPTEINKGTVTPSNHLS